jgi:SAM-dependent methyltransferase
MLTKDAFIDLGVTDRISALGRVLPALDGAYVVDVGCGEGEVARALSTRGARVAGYDPFITPQDDDWTEEGSGAWRLARGTAENIPEPDQSVDAVLFVYSLHHVPGAKLAPALLEAHRILKPDGRLCVVEPIAVGPSQYVMQSYHDETAVRAAAKAALEQNLADLFDSEAVMIFRERSLFADFEAYAARALLGARFNNYTPEQVTAPEVRQRFAEMAALHDGNFDQPVRINLFTGRRAYSSSVERDLAQSGRKSDVLAEPAD